jgi:hypothetical protein
MPAEHGSFSNGLRCKYKEADGIIPGTAGLDIAGAPLTPLQRGPADTYLQTVQGHNACNDGEPQTQPHCILKNLVLEAQNVPYHNQSSQVEHPDSRLPCWSILFEMNGSLRRDDRYLMRFKAKPKYLSSRTKLDRSSKR